MNPYKNITILLVFLVFAFSCKKEVDNIQELENVSAPTNLVAVFDITQDNTGLVTIVPNAEGASEYTITFGDTIPDLPFVYGMDEEITHIYTEGVYQVGVTASGISGLSTSITQELNVTFKAPENLVVTIEQDAVNPRKYSVSATADYATVMDVYFGDVENEEPIHVMPDSIASHIYSEPGDYELKVEAKSGGAATTIYTEIITISAASDPINLPIDFESFTVNYTFTDFDGAISTVIDNPDPSGINTSNRVAQYIKTDGAQIWAGSILTLENPIDFTANKLFKMKVWSPKSGASVILKVENLDNNSISHEAEVQTTTTNEWEELIFDFSSVDITQDYQKVIFFFDYGNPGDDAVYYFDDIVLTSASGGGGIEGTWKVAPEAGALGVGPNQGDISWWSIDDAGVIERDCFFDDTFVFGPDGSFSNVLGAETWIEDWQGGTNACGAPVAPHDGSVAATYIFDEGAGTIMLNGKGAYLGIPKAYNGGELTTPDDAPESITYIMEFSENNTVMTIDIEVDGAWWRYKLVKDAGVVAPPIEGTWQVAAEAGSLGVGPTQGDISWWSATDADITERACFFDDTYVFGMDGSFSNVLGADTWLEDWQIGTFECGTPVAPHDGMVAATYTYDAGSVTLNGTGAYLGIPKAYNGGELTDPANAPESITYILEFSENNTVMIVDIEVDGGWWRYKMVKN